ncbi:YobA family protein [Eubacteriales bacterium OttesenSCG-928-K08]|nr:YobA family protein [Eubacteriales bacterium OttesenSCG-928-K08]
MTSLYVELKKCILCFGMILLLTLCGCTKKLTMHTVLNEPNFGGIVTEVYENSILVAVNEGEDARNSSDLIMVSLNVEIKDSMTQFDVGDEVRVYYDGTIAESYPAQVMKVYAITLIESADTPQE